MEVVLTRSGELFFVAVGVMIGVFKCWPCRAYLLISVGDSVSGRNVSVRLGCTLIGV